MQRELRLWEQDSQRQAQQADPAVPMCDDETNEENPGARGEENGGTEEAVLFSTVSPSTPAFQLLYGPSNSTYFPCLQAPRPLQRSSIFREGTVSLLPLLRCLKRTVDHHIRSLTWLTSVPGLQRDTARHKSCRQNQQPRGLGCGGHDPCTPRPWSLTITNQTLLPVK